MKASAFAILASAIADIPEDQLRPLIDTLSPRSTIMGYLIHGMMRDELLSFEELQHITTGRMERK